MFRSIQTSTDPDHLGVAIGWMTKLATTSGGQEAPNAARKRQDQQLVLMAQETRLLATWA